MGGSSEYPDDGHIFVCVRVRDVPNNTCLTNGSLNTSGQNTTRASTGSSRKTSVREAQKICVSMVENVVVMHDPRSLDDRTTIAKDGNNVVQLLTERANHTGGRRTRKTAGGGPSARVSSRHTMGGAAGRSTALISTGTANYYECDHCIASMDEAAMLKMPLIKHSDFLQPPPYGTQEEVYRRTAMHAVEAAVDGINSCVFAYGQTGSGKTYTLFGDTTNIRRDPGVVPRAVDDLFTRLEAVKQQYSSDEQTDYSYAVQLSFFEIYQNDVFCLFSRQGPLHVQFSRDPSGKRETMVINDLQQQTVTSAEKAYPLIEMGLRRRQTGETGMNARSSRSHAILQIRLQQYRTNRDTRETVEHQSTINLVDLAGSERQKTANTSGKNREEGIQINQSLATLARVINDIASGAKFVNYRDSLLTMVLKDNLGGNSKTFMIATVSPIAFSFQESCATLAYAKDVRKIRNRPMVNKTFQTRANLLEQNTRLKQENDKLKVQMEEWMRRLQNGGGVSAIPVTDVIGLSPIAEERGGEGAASPEQQLAALRRLPTCISPAVAAGLNEAFLSATSAGLTAPLLISSHRKYTSLTGIGGSCVEGGIIRVSSLVRETMTFSLAAVLHQLDPSAASSLARELSAPSGEPQVIVMDEGEEVGADGAREWKSPELKTPEAQTLVAAGKPSNSAEADAGKDALGFLCLERVAQRSCEQHFYVSFVPPANEEALSRIIDVQVNGKSIGTRGRRELMHGDVVCAYLEEPQKGGSRGNGGASKESDDDKKEDPSALKEDNGAVPQEQSLISFHYVDLNCLSRTATANPANAQTLGQIAISIDVPEDMEDMTLDDIRQMQRDNAKLLDMVRQQAETIEYQCQREGESRARMAGSLVDDISPIGSRQSGSPNPRSVGHSPLIGPTPVTVHKVAQEAFRRLSVSPSIRGGSVLPADADADELLRRAMEQSVSQQRMDSVMRENEKLHSTAARRNATLDALAKRLAELEAGGEVEMPKEGSSSSSSSSGEVSISPSADCSEEPVDAVSRSMTRVSSPSASRTETTRKEKKRTPLQAEDDGEPPVERPGDGKLRVYYENAEGTRERYQAVVREREQFERIKELEDLIARLREQLAELESRLRMAKDETLEQQMLREALESERDALQEELADLRAENADLNRENATLETFLHRDEEALEQAQAMAEEEVERQTQLLAQQIKALKAAAVMWKRRTMKYIAMGYGAGDATGVAHLDTIPWDDLRAAETTALIKQRLGPGCTPEMANTIAKFESDTAEENVRALEYALLDFERENARLLEEIERIKAELQAYKDLIERLKGEKRDLEKSMAEATDATEEERRRIIDQLKEKNRQLAEAEGNWRDTQKRLDSAMDTCANNKRKAVKSNELLLSQQKKTIGELERELGELRAGLKGKDVELRNLLTYMEDNDMMGMEGAVRDYELRSRIEDLIDNALKDHDAPTGYSAFPANFVFTDEMIALIRVCLRILLDRLKMELYVLNKPNIHKFELLIPSIQLRPEAQFHSFIHELRGVVSEVAGRTQRIGGKWSITEADVQADLIDHRRRRAGGALNGLLVWYDHWDLSPKTEHISYMELIRNADRIMQMARLVRQESQLNTNATSTSLLPIPGRRGLSDTAMIPNSTRARDKTVQEGGKKLTRMNSSTKQSNLARAMNQTFSTPARAPRDEEDADVENTPFNRTGTLTALALSQTMIPFSRTASRSSVAPVPAPAPVDSAAPFQRVPSSVPRSRPSTSPQQGAGNSSLHTPPRPSAPSTLGASPVPGPALPRPNYGRDSSACAMPVSENDVNYVATNDMANAESINSYNFARRKSAAGIAGDTPVKGADPLGSSIRQPNAAFTRCQTSIPRQREPLTRLSSAAVPSRPSKEVAFGRSRSSYAAPPPAVPSRVSCRSSGRLSASGASNTAAAPAAKRKSSPDQHAPLATRMSSFMKTGTGSRHLSKDSGRANEKSALPASSSSFYNPSVLKSLRERSTSDANRPSVGGTKVRPSTTSTMTAKDKIKGAKPKKSGSGEVPPPPLTFQPSRTQPRLSGSTRLSGRPSALMRSSTGTGLTRTPTVPKLNFDSVRK